jgi:hypothetical protein
MGNESLARRAECALGNLSREQCDTVFRMSVDVLCCKARGWWSDEDTAHAQAFIDAFNEKYPAK